MRLGGDHHATLGCLDNVIAKRLRHGVQRQGTVDQPLNKFETAHGAALVVIDDAKTFPNRRYRHGLHSERWLTRVPTTIAAARPARHPVSACRLGRSRLHDGFQNAHRIGGAVGFALLKILSGLSHRIGDMGETEHLLARGLRECIERGGFHLDRQHAFGARAAAMASAVSRNGASVVQLAPTVTGSPVRLNAASAIATSPGSAWLYSEGAA
jgi:hypothetical protein